jgi:hypothetical protein
MSKILRAGDHELIQAYLDGVKIEFLDKNDEWKEILPYEDKYDIFRISNTDHLFRIKKKEFQYNFFGFIPPHLESDMDDCIRDIKEQMKSGGFDRQEELIKQVAFHFYHIGGEDANPCN